MDALAFLALGPRRGRVAVPLAVATLAAAGWAGMVRIGASMEGHAGHSQGVAALFTMWAAMSVAMMVPIEAPSLVRVARCRAASLTGTGTGGFVGGLRGSASSIACCGLLMLLPFAIGAMNLAWMAALTVLLVVEREVPRASRLGTAAGLLLLALATAVFG